MRKNAKQEYNLISVSHFFPPRVGGLENMAFTLLSELSKKKISCLAVFGSNKTYKQKEKFFHKRSFQPLSIFNNTYPIFGIPFFIYIIQTLKNNPSAKVIIHSRHLTSSLLTSIACTILSRPYTVIEHNAGKIYMDSSWKTKLVNWLDKNIFITVLLNAQDIVAVSKTGKSWIRKNFGIEKDRISVIYNSHNLEGVDVDIAEKKNIVVWAGKLIKVKNPKVVLKAYKKIAKKHPDWLFMIIGEGNLRKALGETKIKNIRIVDQMLKQDELFKLLKESKIYINSSFSEGLSISNLEAIVHGNIPVLSSAPSNMEIAKIIDTKEFIFRRNSSKQLAKILEKAILKSSKQKNIESFVEKCKESFSLEKMVSNYYQMLLPKHHNNDNLKKLSIVIPVYNEESTILKILEKLVKLKLPKNIIKELIIVNDASKDKSLVLINEFVKETYSKTEIKVLENRRNRGKSQTVKKGVLASTGDLVVTQDADLEYDPRDLVKFVKIFLSDPNLDVIYGNRFNSKNTFSNSIHNLGNRFVTYTSNLFTRNKGFAPKDMETCYKMVRGDLMRNIFKTLESVSNFGLEPELTAKLARYRNVNGKHLKFKNVDIRYKPRSIKEGKKMRWWRHGSEAILEIIYFNTEPYTVEEMYKGKSIKRKF